MADITIRFNTDNAAFGETAEEEVAEVSRVLGKLADRICWDGRFVKGDTIIVRDSNGNGIGTLDIEP